ncbi:MAG: (Fe-S)-binding protein [Candidatus Helarchaeota archaeon]
MAKSEYKYLEEVRDMIEACFRCGDCRAAIRPAVGRYLVCPVRETIPGKWEPFFARGKIMLANGLLLGDLKPSQELADIIFQCMICGSCKTICNQSYHPSLKHPLSQLMDHPRIWEALRSELVERGFSIPRHSEILKYCATDHNPYFEKHKDRINWIPQGKSFPEEAEYILFMGCTEPYRLPKILQNILKILDASKVNYTILGQDEWCCGSIALRSGDKKLAKKLAEHNFDAIKKTKASKIITHCAGCYRTIKIDYPQLIPDFDLQTIHITELIKDLLEENRLKFVKSINKKVTYHDPCHLGRHTGIYDAPRFILNQIPGIELIEMPRNKENAWCCGAGGGVKSAYPDLSIKIAESRILEAIESGAELITTACPFCLRNLSEAINNLELELKQKITAVDILELVLKSIEGNNS